MHSRSHPDPSTPRSPRRRRLVVAAAAAIAALGAGVLVAPVAHAADPVTINLVTINDFHGRLEASSPAGGIASLTTAVDQIRAANPNTIFASAGDNIGASTFTSFIQQDNPTIDALNLAGLDVSAVGNHEFDRGFADLTDRVIPRADFPYLGANVYRDGSPVLDEFTIVTVDVDVDVAFIGAVTQEMPSLVSPAGIEGLEFRDIATEVNRVAAALSDGDESNSEADVVIALVHEGGSSNPADAANPATPLGAIVGGLGADVDMLVTAHTHSTYAFDIDGLRVTQAGQYGERFQNTAITYDRDTGEVSLAATATTAMWTVPPAPASPTPNFPQNPAVAALVADAVAFAAVEGAVELGAVTADFNRAIQPRTPTADNPATTEEARGAESTLGNFVADVQLWAAQRRAPDTQIALMNPGGLRANLTFAPDGTVTFAEAAAVQPFANTLVTLTLTGAQLKEVLEQQWQPAAASRPFLKLGVSAGLTYITDYDAPAGSRVTHLALGGVPVDAAASYRIVTNSFLASGGDNFPTLAQGSARADSGEVDLQAMVDWFAEFGTAAPDLAQRAIGLELSPPAGPNGYAPGATIDVSLSSLDFSTSETPAGTVDVAIAGTPVGSAPIDRTPVALTDEAGRAALTVTVPQGVSGTVPLTVTTPVGTSFEVPITVAAPVQRGETVTLGVPHTLLAKQTAEIRYSVVVAARGERPTGEVTVYDGTRPIATATLTAQDKGVVTLKLPRLGRGVHQLWAEYGGSETLAPSKSPKIPVLVW